HKRLFIGRMEDIVTGLVLEAASQILGEDQVEVVATELADPLTADLLKDAMMDAQDRDIESATAEIVDQQGLLFLGIDPVTDGGSGWFVDEGQHLETGRSGTQLGRVTGQALGV